MTSSFSFGFSGEDIEIDEDNIDLEESQTTHSQQRSVDPNEPALLSPQSHSLEDLLSKLPSSISWNSIEIEAPRGRTLVLPRRELFDVKAQLMAEDDDPKSSRLSGLYDSDIQTNIYEGGFKTWECSIDLAKLVLDRGPRKDLDDLCRVNHVAELGCGSAIPSLVLFHYALNESLPLYFTFTDYNISVLQLVTLPNLLLTYVSTLPEFDKSFSGDRNPLFSLSPSSAGDLEVTPTIKSSFTTAILNADIHFTFISGSWSPFPPFMSLIPTDTTMNTFVLASETIYSPAAMKSFAEALIGILRTVRLGKAVVAAKRVYFGVGGGVDGFKRECAELGAVVSDVENHGVDVGGGEGGGVRRCLLEVQML